MESRDRRLSVRIADTANRFPQSEEDIVRVPSRNVKSIYEFFNAILDESIDELNILESIYKEQHLSKQRVVYESLAYRFGSGDKEERDRQQYRINDVYTDKHKLQKEVNLLINILTEASEEIVNDYAMMEFENNVGALEAMRDDDVRLLEDESTNYKKMHELKNKCIKMGDDSKKAINDLDTELYFLKIDCDCTLGDLAERMKYVEKWENSRVEQLKMKLQEQEMTYTNNIKETDRKMDNERRCHNEIMSFLEMSQSQYMDDIEKWMEKYDEDLENLDSDMLKLKIKQQELVESHEKLREEYAKRIQDMIDWKAYKWQKAVEMFHLKMMGKAATKIQVWWREVMIRRKLGPYRKKKGKGKKGDKKGGNKNK